VPIIALRRKPDTSQLRVKGNARVRHKTGTNQTEWATQNCAVSEYFEMCALIDRAHEWESDLNRFDEQTSVLVEELVKLTMM